MFSSNNIHFIYIGDLPQAEKLVNMMVGPLSIISKLTKNNSRSCSFNLNSCSFKFWIKGMVGDVVNWRTRMRAELAQASYIAQIENANACIDILIDSVKALDPALINGADFNFIPAGPKRNVAMKDLYSLAVLKKYGGYFLDNNVMPTAEFKPLSFFREDADFKVPAVSDPSNGARIFTSGTGSSSRRASLPGIHNEHLDYDMLMYPNIECWLIYSVRRGKVIEKIFDKYLQGLQNCNQSLQESLNTQRYGEDRAQATATFLESNEGIGRIIINAILSTVYENLLPGRFGALIPDYVRNQAPASYAYLIPTRAAPTDELTDRRYFWDRDGTQIRSKGVQKNYAGSWRTAQH